ncbi:hypothetical protein HJC99_04135 [Candidatus Saccharibacteria bacterium]|nr:hypothetical protein [Candidatus Saccharibacteria bacterium]
MADKGRKLQPVVWAGVSFLVLAAVLIPIARHLQSSSISALGYETAFDGVMFLAGGLLSVRLERSRVHAFSCYLREGVELAALGSIVFFAIGGLAQPSDGTSWIPAAIGVGSAIVAFALARFWHPRIEAHGGHDGFDWHVVIDAVLAITVAVASVLAWLTGDGRFNFWGALVGAAVALVLSIKPSTKIVGRTWHRASNHPRRFQDHHY